MVILTTTVYWSNINTEVNSSCFMQQEQHKKHESIAGLLSAWVDISIYGIAIVNSEYYLTSSR